jgi:hypothetical protein
MRSKPVILKVFTVVRVQIVVLYGDDTFHRNVGNHLPQPSLGLSLSPCNTPTLVPKDGENCSVVNFVIYRPTPHKKIIRGIKSRQMRWAEHAALMAEMTNAHKMTVGKPE